MTALRALFRVDASRVLASGHVMRCLTLARALAADGVECRFVCRALDGNMIRQISEAGFEVATLPAPPASPPEGVDPRLGVTEADDAAETIAALYGWQPGWRPDRVIVDHYALSRDWERALRPQCAHLMAIDDYTDRAHDCDLLLNQNLGVSAEDYAPGLLAPGCTLLTGTRYALLRPEFARARPAALARRRENTAGGRILVTMGGVDPDNATGTVLAALAAGALPAGWAVNVVMGGQAPHLGAVRAQAEALPFETRIVVDSTEMAGLMVEADFAIGAAGSTSWERCTLALPSIVVVLADNQEPLARALVASGAALRVAAKDSDALAAAVSRLANDPDLRRAMAQAAAAVADGNGTALVAAKITGRPAKLLERTEDV